MIVLSLSLLLITTVAQQSQQYKKHITPIDYEVPHEVIFQDQRCWTEDEGDLIVPRNCSGNYCSKCYFNSEIKDYRRHLMSYDDNRLIVAALDTILQFDVTADMFYKQQTVSTEPSLIDADAISSCLGEKAKQGPSCKNYNRVLLDLPSNGEVLTCGTTAYKVERSCQIREAKNLEPYSALNGEGMVPMNEDALNTAIVSDSRIFAGTMISSEPSQNYYTISSAKISSTDGNSRVFSNIVSTQATAAWLNRAKFVSSFTSGDYAYFLFQELDYEELNPGKKLVVSRIARVCKEDIGVQASDIGLDNAKLWKTFVKARIYCENKVIDDTFGEQIFAYNRIGDGVLDKSSDSSRVLYATFSEGDTSASGSVVCRYNLDDIDENFNRGLYYSFREPVSQTKRTQPTCEEMANVESSDIYELRLTVTDIKSNEPPLFLQSGPQFTKIIIDSSIRNLTNPVLFIGTRMGKVLKVTWLTLEDGSFQPYLIEQLQVAVGNIKSDLTVYFLAFEKTVEPNYLLVGTGVSVAKVIISRCQRIPGLQRSCCYASKDPYCGWCDSQQKCSSRPDCSANDWTQSLTANDSDNTCPGFHTPPQLTSPTPHDLVSGTSHVTDSGEQDNTPEPVTILPSPTTPEGPTQPPPTTQLPTDPKEPTEPPPTEPPPSDPIKPHPTFTTHNNTRNESTASSSTDATEERIVRETDSWKTVAIVMAILCGIFVLISLLLALNLVRRWCTAKKLPLKSANNNLQHSYNPLSSVGTKTDDFSDRIPVYNTRTNNV